MRGRAPTTRRNAYTGWLKGGCMSKYVVANCDEVEEGQRILVELEGKPIGIFNVDGEYKAYLSWCAHQSGPLCEGNISGTSSASFDPDTLQVTVEWIKEREILNCPWHGWEYDLEDGSCLSREGVVLPSFPVTVEDDEIIVEV